MFRLVYVAAVVSLSVGLGAQPIDLDEARADEEFRWGVTAYHLGQYGDAVLAFERTLAFQPQSTSSRTWLGLVYHQAGFVDLAIDQWRVVLADDEPNAVVRRLVDAASLRRGLGPELRPQPQFVASDRLDAKSSTAYPFRRPSAVVARDDGRSYLVAFGSDEVLELDINGIVRRVLRGGLNGLQSPFDVEKVGDQLYVSEYGANRISRLTADGGIASSFGESGRGPGQLLGPQYLASDADGFLYVTDWGNRRVAKFDQSGRPVLTFGEPTSSFPGLRGPSGLAIIGAEVYVADRSRLTLEVFDRSGNHLRSLHDELLLAPEGLAVADGHLLVADTTSVLRLDLAREVWEVLPGTDQLGDRLIDITVTANGDLLAVDFDASVMHTLTDVAHLTNGFTLSIRRADSVGFPEVLLEVAVEDRYGAAVLGLAESNFLISERRIPVDNTTLLSTPASRRGAASVVILIENSPRMRAMSGAVQEVLDQLERSYTGGGPLPVVSVGANPVDEGDARDASFRVAPFLRRADNTARWQFDRGIRFAVAKLLSSRATRAVLFLGSGRLPDQAFDSFSLSSAAAYLANNHVAFYPIALDGGSADELAFLSERSRGREFNALDAIGVREVMPTVVDRLVPVYVLAYNSDAEPDFGLRFLEVEVEVALRNVTGRAELGYYAPRTF